MTTISSCIPADAAERMYDSQPDYAEYDARERERRVEEELAYLICFPGDYCEKADDDIFAQLVKILTDGQGDERGRCRDVLEPDMRRVAEKGAERD